MWRLPVCSATRPCQSLVGMAMCFFALCGQVHSDPMPDLALIEMLGEMGDAEDIGVDVDAWIDEKFSEKQRPDASQPENGSVGEQQ